MLLTDTWAQRGCSRGAVGSGVPCLEPGMGPGEELHGRCLLHSLLAIFYPKIPRGFSCTAVKQDEWSDRSKPGVQLAVARCDGVATGEMRRGGRWSGASRRNAALCAHSAPSGAAGAMSGPPCRRVVEPGSGSPGGRPPAEPSTRCGRTCRPPLTRRRAHRALNACQDGSSLQPSE